VEDVDDQGAVAQAVMNAIIANKGNFDDICENQVTPAFEKFDKDGSGAIDRDELAQLSKELGHELNEEQLEAALVDLDLNKDGVIDMDEFKRWYFTGMKPYNGSTRTMLKIGGKAM